MILKRVKVSYFCLFQTLVILSIMSVQTYAMSQFASVKPNQGEISDTLSGKANLMYISLSHPFLSLGAIGGQKLWFDPCECYSLSEFAVINREH